MWIMWCGLDNTVCVNDVSWTHWDDFAWTRWDDVGWMMSVGHLDWNNALGSIDWDWDGHVRIMG